MSKGDLSPSTLTILYAPFGEVQQLIVRAIGDPGVAILSDADPHQRTLPDALGGSPCPRPRAKRDSPKVFHGVGAPRK